MDKPEEIITDENIIEVISCRFSIDWTYDERHKINLKDIWGFELHWRGDNWHVVVITKDKDLNLKPVTYELSHWVGISEVRKLTSNPKVKIKKIVNYHSSDNFIDEVRKILPKNIENQ